MKEFNIFVLTFYVFFHNAYAQNIFDTLFGTTRPPPIDEYQTRRYRCNAVLGFGVSKSCLCIMKVVRKKGGFFSSIGCDNNQLPVDDIMMEVNAIYNFSTVSVLSNDLFGNSCPIGTDDDFFRFVDTVTNYRLSFTKPCPFPALGRFETVDADFDSRLVETLQPILPAGGGYNAYVRVYRNTNNLTLAFQTLYGSTPLLDLGLGTLPVIGNLFG